MTAADDLAKELAGLGPATREAVFELLVPFIRVTDRLKQLAHAIDADGYHKTTDRWGFMCDLCEHGEDDDV
jgi:hypothetical protein